MLNLGGGAISAIATFALTVVLTRGLAAADAGAFFTVTSLFLLLASLGQLGTDISLVYFLARQEPERRREEGPAYVRTARTPVLGLAVATGVVLVVLAPQIASLIGAGANDSVVNAIRLLGPAVPLAAALNLHTAALRGLDNMIPTAVLDQIARPALQLILVAFAVPSGSVALVVAAWVLPYLPTAVAALAWWRKDLRGHTPAPRRPGTRREFWRFTAPRALAGVAQLALQRLDIVLVGVLAGLREAAIYTAASRFLVLGQLVGTAISRAVQPRLARAIGSRDLVAARDLYQTSTAWLVLLAWPLYLVMALGATTLMRLFGSGYAAGAHVVVILSLTMLVATGCGMVDVVLIMAGKTSWNLANVLASLTVNISLNLVLIPRYGITGAGVAWAAAILCANLVPLVQVRWAIHLHPFGRATIVAMALSAGFFGAVPGLAAWASGGSALLVVPVIAACALAWTAAVWRARETLRLNDLVAGFGRRRTAPGATSLS